MSEAGFSPPETAETNPIAAGNWCVYLILCADHSLYCGISNRPARRFSDHAAGKGAKYTRLRKPVSMRLVARNLSKSEALKQECTVKQLSAERKRSLWATLPEFEAV
ncbi:GIY-YIG nuclease family protein [Neisseria lisongii]|uniref:GIY-YIG nuclease family protein n=1 Tax=Neisseria lisongii TaxID=2912188 RepID=UPI0023515C0D|nr:GIY-YIG nuclease family protein [Neisseria lisongii]